MANIGSLVGATDSQVTGRSKHVLSAIRGLFLTYLAVMFPLKRTISASSAKISKFMKDATGGELGELENGSSS